MLEDADHQHALVAGDDVLGAVAVVHVEIDDRHALQAAHIERVARCDRDVVEEAEAHRLIARRVVAGRAHRAERAFDLAVDHRVGRGDRGAGGAQRGVQGAGTRGGVGVDRSRHAAACDALQKVLQLGHVTGGVREHQVIELDERRVAALERHVQAGGQQVVVDRVEPLRAFGMPAPHVVAAAIRVAVVSGCHRDRDRRLEPELFNTWRSVFRLPSLA